MAWSKCLMSLTKGMSGWGGLAPAYRLGPLTVVATGLETGVFGHN